MRQTQRKGDRATARAIASFTAIGYDVSIPLTESAAYDLVVDADRHLYRVQCKYISGRQVDLRRIHSNAGGFVVKRGSGVRRLVVRAERGRSGVPRQGVPDGAAGFQPVVAAPAHRDGADGPGGLWHPVGVLEGSHSGRVQPP